MPAARPLYLYKFHATDCKVHRINPALKPTAKKFYRYCDCFIWITGVTAKGEFVPRQTTKLRDWEAAEAYLISVNKQVAAEIVHGDHGITLENATRKFLDSHVENVKEKAMEQHTLVLERLKTYAAGQGVSYAQGVTYDLCKDFLSYGFPGIGDNTKTTYRAKLKVFLAEAFIRKWIKEDIAKLIKNVSPSYEQGEPYTDEEITSILTHAENLNGGTTGYASNGKTFRLLLEFMLETGLRVSDAVRYNPKMALKSSLTGLWKYTYTPLKQKKGKKTKSAVTFLEERLKTAIDEAEWFSKNRPFAYDIIDDDKHERAVYERMQSIGARYDVADCRPHRLRDTFAVSKLQKGMALDDVSKLLGHGSVKVTSDHYAKWTVGREDRLESLFYQTTL